MPRYTYGCTKCGLEKSVRHKMSETPQLSCESCKHTLTKKVVLSAGGYTKSMTPAKAFKEEKYRRKKNADLEVRQLERYGSGGTLVPNLGGEEFESWKEAKKFAESNGSKDTSSMDKYIREESETNNSRRLNEVKLKELKEKRRQIY